MNLICVPLLFLISLINSAHSAEAGEICVRTPSETSAARSAGSNGFSVDVQYYPINATAKPAGYVPGEMYLVVLEGFRTRYTEQTFRGFSIAALSEDDAPRHVGSFKLSDTNVDVKMSDRCTSGVGHTTLHPKTRLEVMWQAPATNQGCIEFKAMVLEYRDIWYMDDGPLSYQLCQIIGYENMVPDDEADECCACDEAKYELVFDGIWSRQTHVKDYPTIEQLTHFSDIIGASHSTNYGMWKFGGYATDGLKELAEWGNTLKMEEELKDIGKDLRTIVKARGLWYPNVQGTTRAVFRVDQFHHLFSLASMMGPSPDWCVGISRVNLCRKDCTWVDERVFDLFPWDAGTDSGTTYMSPNNPSLPRQPIKPITTKDPRGSPFYNPKSDIMPALATITLRRQKVYEMECKNQSYYEELSPFSQTETSEDLLYKNRPECSVGGWSPWSTCSATCGKGIRMRSRSYKRAFKAQASGCRRQTIEKQFCSAPIPECYGSDIFNEMCTPTQWSAWTDCSVSCGIGMRYKTRQYAASMAVKVCNAALKESQECQGAQGDDCSAPPDPRCRTTVWSEWSPCSVSCGHGSRVRTRLLYAKQHADLCSNLKYTEKQTCKAAFENCEEIIYKHKEEICVEPVEPGECGGVFPRYYYDAGAQQCKRFIYSGCKGNRNRFDSESQCTRACITGPDATTEPEPEPVPVDSLVHALSIPNEPDSDALDQFPQDCLMSPWSVWSDCSASCGLARRKRTRIPSILPRNGGNECPPNKEEYLKCRVQPCRYRCDMNPWTSWTECSVSCSSGFQTRTRSLSSSAPQSANVHCPSHRTIRRICYTGVGCP